MLVAMRAKPLFVVAGAVGGTLVATAAFVLNGNASEAPKAVAYRDVNKIAAVLRDHGADGCEADATRRSHALADALLERYGVVIRGAVAAERSPGGFAAVYPVLRAFEESGRCRRGYFVEGLGAAQFALPGAVDRLRALRPREPADPWQTPAPQDGERALVLAAADPANPYGAALPWPGRDEEVAGGHKPGRKAGALVVLVEGRLVLYVERGGRTLLTWSDDPRVLQPAVDALALAVREGALGKLTVERADGASIGRSPLAAALEAAGFHPTPRGLRLRG